ncbi:toxin-antitoxin system TumE family protein [Pyrodictium abyssi]|uniref:DUF6516 family protein n=1 Tax=Pyrodictium abyssi TaxID=54256 RepID=A0ABM8J0K3_9CREN|nr:DUF6516 family protein [Pyrodictium abyssi]
MRRRYGSFRDYASWFHDVISSFGEAIVDYSISIEEVTPSEGLIRGVIVFLDGSRLRFLEYVSITGGNAARLKYRYHYEDPDGRLVFRYDNAPHHPEVETFPHHKHLGDGRVVASIAPSIRSVLEEILDLIPV